MRYAYYPGCYAKGTAASLDAATCAVCERLGVVLEELTAAPCCGAGDVQQVDGTLAQGLNELTLAQAAGLGLDVLTVCNVCTLSLRQAAAAVESADRAAAAPTCLAVADPGCETGPAAGSGGHSSRTADGAQDQRGRPEETGVPPQEPGVPPGFGHLWPPTPEESAGAAARALGSEGLEYTGGTRITHLLWALRDDVGLDHLAAAVTLPLDGLTLAPFYGCQILRPAAVNDDDVADDPTALEDLIDACGGRSVDYDGRLKCCGWPVMYVRQQAALAMATGAVRNALAAGADALVTPCPLCQAALEGCQSADGGGAHHLPVLHLPQVVGLALGCSPGELGLTGRATNAGPVLARLGLTLA